MKKIAKYLITILIACGLYFVSSLIGSVFNVMIAFTSGFDSYKEFISADNVIFGIIAMYMFSIANHAFFAFVTVKTVSKYVQNRHSLSVSLFRCAAIAIVVLALFIMPFLFSNQAGWFTYLTHAIWILLFGKNAVKKGHLAKITPPTVAVSPYVIPSQIRFCHQCGIEIKSGSTFCHQCGAKLN